MTQQDRLSRVRQLCAAMAALLLWGSPAGAAHKAASKSQGAPSASLALHVALEKPEFSLKAPDSIMLRFSLRNTGQSPVWVNSRFYLGAKTGSAHDREVYLEVVDGAGQPVPCEHSFPTGLPKSDYFKLLQPGEEATADYPRDLRGFCEVKGPGTYTVTAVYENVFGPELDLAAFKGPLRSDPVAVKVVE